MGRGTKIQPRTKLKDEKKEIKREEKKKKKAEEERQQAELLLLRNPAPPEPRRGEAGRERKRKEKMPRERTKGFFDEVVNQMEAPAPYPPDSPRIVVSERVSLENPNHNVVPIPPWKALPAIPTPTSPLASPRMIEQAPVPLPATETRDKGLSDVFRPEELRMLADLLHLFQDSTLSGIRMVTLNH